MSKQMPQSVESVGSLLLLLLAGLVNDMLNMFPNLFALTGRFAIRRIGTSRERCWRVIEET
jgi:hypothetical protein